jgi:hypothetical protein
MYKSIIFVDFENIQKLDKKLIDSNTKIIVMVGSNQDNKAFDFAKDLFANISSIELIKVNGQGKNALDIFIAFYIGKYFDSIKGSEIIIYSNDTDYNPLIKHISGKEIAIKNIGLNKNSKKKATETKITKNKKEVKNINSEMNNITQIIEHLKNQTESQKSKRPTKKETLVNHLFTHFSKNISLENIDIAIDYMIKNNYIIINNNKINYNKI